MNKHIVLVGFMCSGKTTFGKLLSNYLNKPFIDIDEYISQKQNKTVADIFSEYGENYFRQLEHSSLKELLQAPPSVIASGGGTPCFNNNMDLMNNSAITVYLQTNAQTIFEWLKGKKYERPLLEGKTDSELLNYIKDLLEKRKKYYEQAHITIAAINPNVKDLVDKIELLL